MKKRKPLLKGGQGTTNPLPPTRTQKAAQAIVGLENMASSYLNPYSGMVRGSLDAIAKMSVGDKKVDPKAINLLHKANNTLDKVVSKTVEAIIPGGKTPLIDYVKAKKAKKKAHMPITTRIPQKTPSPSPTPSPTPSPSPTPTPAPAPEKEEEEEEKKAEREGKLHGGSLLSDDREQYEEGGELDDQMEDLMNEEETHTMPDGTEMEGATHGEYDEQMGALMDKETPMLPDEEMEEDYVNYVIEEALPSEDRNYLISALEKDDRLSEIFDQVVESATEFSGSGPIEGPGTEKSDSIPARLSDGEFVFTAKATEEIGVDTLMSMMADAESGADERQGAAYGGMIEDEGDPKAVPIQTTGLLSAQGNIPSVVQPNKEIDEEMLKASPRRYYVPLSG